MSLSSHTTNNRNVLPKLCREAIGGFVYESSYSRNACSSSVNSPSLKVDRKCIGDIISWSTGKLALQVLPDDYTHRNDGFTLRSCD